MSKKTDRIGDSFSVANPISAGDDALHQQRLRKLDENLGKSRFAAPLFLILLLTAKNIANGGNIAPFNLVPRESFLPALAGFLTYRLSLFVTEVATELTGEDLLGFLPGSVAEGIRLNKKLAEQQAVAAAAGEDLEEEGMVTKVLFVTGPRAAGRLGLVSSLGGKKDSAGRVISRVKFLTTDPIAPQRNPERYISISEKELYDLRRMDGALVYEGVDKTIFGSEVTVALSRASLLARSDGGVRVVDGDPKILDALRKQSMLQLSPVWVSLQTKEQFIDKASSLVREEIEANGGSSSSAEQATDKVSTLVNEAAQDITYYMQKAPLFEYTLLNLGSDQETFEELFEISKQVAARPV